LLGVDIQMFHRTFFQQQKEVPWCSTLLRLYCTPAHVSYSTTLFLKFTGATGPGGPEFTAYKEKTEAEHGVQFLMSLADLPDTGKKRLALISGRTADNPKLMSEAIKVCMLLAPRSASVFAS
jgi:hypothetical protein